ncbi:MAG TPA: alpha/beta hydrolase [Prochlorococcus sp.]
MLLSRSWLRHRREQLRLSRRLVVVLLVAGVIASSFCVAAIRHDAMALISGESFYELLKFAVLVLAILIPLSGIYSVMLDFVFWEGWLDGLPDPKELFTDVPPKNSGHLNYIIYLDGIHQSEEDHPPRVSEFLAKLEEGIDADSMLVKGIEAYTVMPVALRSVSYSQWFWRWLFSLQEEHPNALVSFISSFFVQANNVIKVGISSDRRYGPVMNYELSLKIARRLESVGFHPCSAERLVLVGYSGGGEMAIGTAEMLQRLCRVPVQVITVCGVFSGNGSLDDIDRVAMVVGSKDPVAAFGRLAYPGRLPMLPLSNWNRWQRHRKLARYQITDMSHSGSSGPFSDCFSPQVVGAICRELVCSAPN